MKRQVLDVAIGKFQDLLKKILRSPKILEALRNVCSTLKVPYKFPELDVQARWNSIWEMMSGVVSLRRALEELLHKIYKRYEGFCQFIIGPNDDLAKPISEQTWYAMGDFCNFLLPFKQATVLLSGSDYPTLGMDMPVFHIITKHFKISITANTGFRSTYTIEFATPVLEKII